jgi:hypothetical protein
MGLQAHSLWEINCEGQKFITTGTPNFLDAVSLVDSIRKAEIPAEQQSEKFAGNGFT